MQRNKEQSRVQASESTPAPEPAEAKPAEAPTATNGSSTHPDPTATNGAPTTPPVPDNGQATGEPTFDFDSIRVNQDFASLTGVKKILLKVPVLKVPDRFWWAR